MNIRDYREKVQGCWLGKNIGGTLGTPFEGYRGAHDIDYYTQDMSAGALPNDDLDLQLIWLNAAEKYGKGVNSTILGDYWLTYIVGNWAEYGASKNNMANGILPPVSGWYNNHNRNSDGAFIRSEIWACLMPGHPELAVEYAYEDASVDHFGEGIYGEIFTAAIESAAFSENDIDKLIEIGLSYIPSDSDTARAVNLIRDCYNSGLSWMEARKKLLKSVPCAFGTILEDKTNIPEPDIPTGTPGYDLPANIGLLILGLVYGEGDFGKSICICAGSGEDGDCTAATAGAILGIINGAKNIPKKWVEPIGDEIKTLSINLAMNSNVSPKSIVVPQTVTETTDRVCNTMPIFMYGLYDVFSGDITMCDSDKMMCKDKYRATFISENFRDIFSVNAPVMSFQNMFLKALLKCTDGINIEEEKPLGFTLETINLIPSQQWLNVRMFMPSEWECSAGKEFAINLDQPHAGFGRETVSFELIPHNITASKTEIVIEISSVGKLGKLYIPVSLFRAPQTFREIPNKL